MLDWQRQRSNGFLALLALPATAMGFALSVQISALSWILTTRYGLHIDEIGLVWAAGPVAGILGQLLVGVFSDDVWLWGGRRRPFIVLGGALTALTLLALPHIGWLSHALGVESILGVAITVALALDLAINVSFNPTRAIITDLTADGAERTRGYTWMQTVSGSFGVLAYGVGAVWGNTALIYTGVGLVLAFSLLPAALIEEPKVLQAAPSAADATPISWRTLWRLLLPLWGFLAYDVVSVTRKVLGVRPTSTTLEWLGAIATLLCVVVTLLARDRGPAHRRADLVEFRKVLAAHAFSWIGVQTMFVYMIAFVQQRFPALDAHGGGQLLSTAFFLLSLVAAILPSTVLAPLARRFGAVRVHTACLAVMALAYGGEYVFGVSASAVYAIMALAGVGWASIVSLPFAIMSERVDESRIGYFMGVFNLSIVLPQLVASLAVGALIAALPDKGAMFLVAAVSLALSAVCWLFVTRDPPAD
jgi:maltose/moltooligosaccharide transporter